MSEEPPDCGHIYVDQPTLKKWLASIGKRDYFHPSISVRHSQIAGYGLFATTLIKKGELISYEDVNDYFVFNRETIDNMSPEAVAIVWHFSYQVGDDAWFGPRARDVIKRKLTFFENHSCDPSTWFEDDITMTARRDIQPGDVITYDSSTTESFIDPEMETVVCRCCSPLCRGRFLGSDWMRPELQARYSGHWMSYIEAKIFRIQGRTLDADLIEARSRTLLCVDGVPPITGEVDDALVAVDLADPTASVLQPLQHQQQNQSEHQRSSSSLPSISDSASTSSSSSDDEQVDDARLGGATPPERTKLPHFPPLAVAAGSS